MKDVKDRIQSIFAGAFEHESAAAIEHYLDEACRGDDEIRREVEGLLVAHQMAGAFLGGTSPNEAIGIAENPIDLCGTCVDQYELVEILGEGGMGTVYLARQSAPVRRHVAIKLIKPGMDSKQVIARFDAERQALAMMDHPNVAKVLDAGTTGQGRPYFVMELVSGTSITEFCDQQQFSTRQRLELFVHVCRAVQHAHQKGIIHRDLKPSNIMVTMSDNRAIPKVIDFGVAKALHVNLTDKAIITGCGQLVGTPMYMSPEQAQMTSLDVDTRSDIYSLGVLLYELLTGMAPFDRETFKEAEFDEIRRIIREDEPPRPSDRVSTLNAELQTTISDQRRVDRRTLSHSLRGDLDWIVMKALEKDRTRRYATADELAAEIGRFLNNEPVNAGPPSATYRFKKFAQRNKTAIVFLVTISAALVLGIVGTTWQAIRATSEASRATRQTRIAQAVEQFWNEDVLLQADPFRKTIQQSNRGISLREVFDLAAEKAEQRFGDEPLIRAAIYRVLSTGYYNLGHYEKALELVNREIPLRESPLGTDDPAAIDARSRRGLFLLSTGESDQAITILEAELALCRRVLPADDNVTLDSMNRLARAFIQATKYDLADALLGDLLELETGKYGDTNSNTCSTLIIMGGLRSKLGQDEEAERLFTKALDIFENSEAASHPHVLAANQKFGRHLLGQKRYQEAESYLRKSWIMAKAVLGVEHPITKMVGIEFANSLTNLRRSKAESSLQSGDYDQFSRLDELSYAREVLDELVSEYPDDLELKISLAGNLCNSGVVVSQGDKPRDSIGYGHQAITLLDEILQLDRDNSRAIGFRANTLYMLAIVHHECGDYDQSVGMLEKAIDVLQTKGDLIRSTAFERSDFLGMHYLYYGKSCEALDRPEEAVRHYERANGLFSEVLAMKPDYEKATRQLLEVLELSTSLYMSLHRAADALRTIDQLANTSEESLHPHRELFRELLRAYVKAANNEYKLAVEIADKHWLQPDDDVSTVSAGVWTWAASAYAISAKAVLQDQTIPETQRGELANDYGARAVDVLRCVLASDEYSTPSKRKELMEDEDYSILRGREDFQKLFPEK